MCNQQSEKICVYVCVFLVICLFLFGLVFSFFNCNGFLVSGKRCFLWVWFFLKYVFVCLSVFLRFWLLLGCGFFWGAGVVVVVFDNIMVYIYIFPSFLLL